MLKQRFTRLGIRLPLAVAAVAAAIATVAIVAGSGSAQSAPMSLHLVGKSQNKVGFFPKHRPHQGDRFGFGDKVSGDDTGTSTSRCARSRAAQPEGQPTNSRM